MQIGLVNLYMNCNHTHQLGDSACLWGEGQNVKYLVDTYVYLYHIISLKKERDPRKQNKYKSLVFKNHNVIALIPIRIVDIRKREGK